MQTHRLCVVVVVVVWYLFSCCSEKKSLPVHLPVCSRDREGCRGHIWVCVPQEVFLPDLPRVSSCGGPTPGPRCPAGGCNAGAGALNCQKRQCNTHTHVYRKRWFP